MDKKVNKFLRELYQLDNNLKQYEKELVKIINNILASRPDAKFDDGFKRQLRDRLMVRAQELSSKPLSVSRLNINFNYMQKLSYMVLGVFILGVMAIPIWYYYDNQGGSFLTGSNTILAGGVTIDRVGGSAFGQFNNLEQAFNQVPGLGDGTTAVRTESGGGSAGGFGSIDTMPSPLIYQPKNYKFIYEGDDLNFDQDVMPVYKRVIGGSAASRLAQIIQQAGLGLMDVSKFSNTKVQNIGFIEDKNDGYGVYINFNEEQVSINQYNDQWVGLERAGCAVDSMGRGDCPPPSPLTSSDIPSDSALISLANNFISKYGIDLSAYGDPQVEKSWERYVALDQGGYLPEIINVIYPLIINDGVVYDEGGNIFGLNVNINVRYNKVIGLYNHRTNNYQSSDYSIITDEEKIMKFVEQGGVWPVYNYEGGEVVEITVGSPVISYVKVHNYDSKDNYNAELLVPALIFPVQDISDNEYYRQNIVIPLLDDVLNRYDNSGPRILPAVEIQ